MDRRGPGGPGGDPRDRQPVRRGFRGTEVSCGEQAALSACARLSCERRLLASVAKVPACPPALAKRQSPARLPGRRRMPRPRSACAGWRATARTRTAATLRTGRRSCARCRRAAPTAGAGGGAAAGPAPAAMTWAWATGAGPARGRRTAAGGARCGRAEPPGGAVGPDLH